VHQVEVMQRVMHSAEASPFIANGPELNAELLHEHRTARLSSKELNG